MRKTKTRHNGTSDTKEARMEAAQFFVKGDRVCNRVNGKMGLFTGINEGFALPEVWVAFDSDTDSRIPISCNPLDLELAQKDCPEHKVLRQLGMLGDTQLPQSNTWHNGYHPGMRVWSDRTITHKDKPEQVMRMTGKVVGVISRLIVPDQTSEDPIDTPLVEVQWDGVQSTALLSPWELHIESAVQNTGDTPALADEAAVTPEVAEELAGSSTNHALEAESQAISQEVRDMAATVDNTSVTAVEVLEELTPEEEADRHRLEIKVDRGFYEVGCALRELKQRRLFRSTHHNWEVYCRERFQFGRDSADNKIKVAEVFENLEEKLPSNARQFLPTSERQVLPLTKLSPDKQRQAWQQAVEVSSGKLPSGRIIKGIVERLKEKSLVKAHEFCQIGQVFTLTGLVEKERKYNRCWAIAIAVRDFTVEVEVHDSILTVKPDNLNPIDSPDAHRQLPQTLKRIKRLRNAGLLDRGAYNVLENLGRQTYLTNVEEKLLSCLEEHYGIKS